MKLFFREQYTKIAWRRVFIVAGLWTVFSMQSADFRSNKYETPGVIGYAIGHGGTATILLSVIGAVATKKEGLKKEIES